MASSQAQRQKVLKEFIKRRHPEYAELCPHWDFLEDTYEGGREWFESNIHRYMKEGDIEFKQRVNRAYRFNHTREVVDIVDKYIFKMQINRDKSRAPDSVKQFWRKATLSGLSIQEFAKQISNRSSVFGRAWIVVDSTNDGEIKTKADEKEGLQIYAYLVEPEDVLDMSYDEQGEMNWILIHETVRDDADPIESTGDTTHRYRLWTREFWQVFTIEKNRNGQETVVEGPQVSHGLGKVPIIPADNVISSDEPYSSPSMIADVAYLDRAVANYLSNLDAIIQDQTFSQLAMPAQGLSPGEDAYNKLIEMGTKRIFLYDGESGSQPFYLSPDVRQAELILKVVNKIINEIYHSVGLAGERTKEDNALGIDNSSGVAKAYDFERVNSLLASKADSLEWVENRIAEMVALWAGEEVKLEDAESGEAELVEYPDNFDVRGLYDEFEIAARLSMVEAPDSVRREQMNAVIAKLFPQLSEDLKNKMQEELKSWPPKIDLMAAGGDPASPSAGAGALKKSGTRALAGALVHGNASKV